jgi:hypothetical protein
LPSVPEPVVNVRSVVMFGSEMREDGWSRAEVRKGGGFVKKERWGDFPTSMGLVEGAGEGCP